MLVAALSAPPSVRNMEHSKVLDLYDDAFAAEYDDRFLLTWWGREGVAFELAVISDALGSDGTLLDVACGTGWVLSQFPTHVRAGIDLSPAMLARARTRPANRTLEFRLADYRSGQPDWDDQWDVVSCMWFAYCYVDTVPEVGQLITNLASWTAPSGSVFLPICDPEGIGLAPIQYRKPAGEFSSEMRVTSFTWSWDDPVNHKWHEHLVAPHEEYLIELFARHFQHIRIAHYPPLDFDGYIYRRRALLASDKRRSGDGAPVTVTRDPASADASRERSLADRQANEQVAARRLRPTLQALAKRGALRGVRALERRLDD